MVRAKEKALAAREKASLVRRLPNRTPEPPFLVRCFSYYSSELLSCLWSKVSPNPSDHTSLVAFEEIRDELPHLDHIGSKGASRQVISQGEPTLGPTSRFGAPRGSNTRRPGLAAAQKDEPASKPHHCIFLQIPRRPSTREATKRRSSALYPVLFAFLHIAVFGLRRGLHD